jgi:hypothetical protein
MAFDANGKLLYGNDGGIDRLDNPNVGSIRWTTLNGNLQIALVINVSLHPTSPDIAIAGIHDTWAGQFSDSRTWNALSAAVVEGPVAIDPVNPSTMYASNGMGSTVGNSSFCSDPMMVAEVGS